MLYNMDNLDFLRKTDKRYDCIFADPPDNLGLAYDGFKDEVEPRVYYDRLELLVRMALGRTKVLWLSYYWRHDIELKYRFHALRDINFKSFIWRYTFGQYKDSDCGSGFRYILRMANPSWRPDTRSVRVQSVRQAIGDKRACPDGRVPDDVWDFDADGVWTEYPRVTGNSEQRREWHPTQHPEALIERIIRLSGAKSVLDLYSGTHTTLRVCDKLKLDCDAVEISPVYCGHYRNQ